jgi:hypothetical protein
MGHTIKVYFHRFKLREGLQANLNSVARLRSPRTVVVLATAVAGVGTLLLQVASPPGEMVAMPLVVAGRSSSTTDQDVETSVSLTKISIMGSK